MRSLIAVDDSKDSWDAVAFAQEVLAEDDEVLIVNVVRADRHGFVPVRSLTGYGSAYAGYSYSPSDHDLATTSEDERERAAQQTVDFAAGALGADTSIVTEGEAASRICETAAEIDADMIILGTRGHGPLRRLLSGSVSRSVLDQAPCSVLIVK